MNSKSKIIIPKTASLFEAMRLIEKWLQDHQSSVLIDMSNVSFPLTRDVFFVLAKRFPVEKFKLLLRYQHQIEMAKSASIQASLSGVTAEFEREFENKNLLKHNFTMWEYFLYELKRWFMYIGFLFRRKKSAIPLYKMRKSNPNMFLIVSGLIMSLSLLLFIFYFTVSKTYVYVTPQISVRPISANIIFSQNTGSLVQSKNTINMKKIALPIEHTMKFSLDTIDPNSATNAYGTVTIYNELTTDQALKPNTRFITEEGIVFRTESWINVPKSKTENGITQIGTAEAVLRADPSDEAGRVIGSRWNVPIDTIFSIPGLKFNRDKVYAKAKTVFAGGTDPKIHVITEAEIQKFRGIMHEQISRVARTKLQSWIETSNTNGGEQYALLMWDSVVFSGETIVINGGKKVGDLADEVELKWTIHVTALVYNQRETINYLTTIFREKLLYGTDKELGIHEDTLRLTNVVSRTENDSTIKATMEMNATLTYDLENASNELTRRMKVIIAWLSEEEAITRLINEWHVREVSIRFSPFWMSHVSSNMDNIEFIIKNE